MGDLPGGAVSSRARAVSADGLVVVGTSESSDGDEAFRWTEVGGLTGLGFLSAGVPFSDAAGVSGDGAVVVGSSHDGNGDRAFRWTAGGGLVALGTFSCSGCDPAAGANDVSEDGLVAVGAGLAKSLFGDPHLDAARWTGGGTGISDLGDLPGPAEVNGASGASSDGAVIVGSGDSSAGFEGWVWTGATGMDALPGVPGAMTGSSAFGVSSDGTVVVGRANTDSGSSSRLEAARWSGPGYASLELLGSLGTPASHANAVSGAGEVVVGMARNADNDRRAFVWDAVSGMRDLGSVLESDFGIDLGGWVLEEAHDVSDLGPAGELTIVGEGRNPAGEPEGFVAFLFPPACRDGEDNDGDGDVDFPEDDGCTAAVDLSETADCGDGLDNDGDDEVDFPTDAGCRSLDDATELPDCANGIDDDGDGLVDYPDDPGCRSPDSPREDPACDDSVDNDGNGEVDHPDDPGCVAAWDLSEGPDCADGLDNDGDGDFDHPADADCSAATDASEDPECGDGIDNDGDGRIDAREEFPDCVAENDPVEAPQCGDGIDNDGDGDVDLADAGCTAPNGAREDPVALAGGDLLVVDRTGRVLFRVDPLTGAQQLVSQAGWLDAPQSVAQRADATVVVADDRGLVEIAADTGQQALRSDPLLANEGLALVFDPGSGDALVLEAAGITRITWNPTGIGVHSPWLAVPTPEPIPVLGALAGDTLAVEAAGTLLTSGTALFGDGVFRVDATPAATPLKPGFASEVWLDLELEADGSIVAVGEVAASGPGVYRIDPIDGSSAAVSVGPDWARPTGIAVAADGTLFVADAGAGEIVEVDPGTGARSIVTSGGAIAGEMDLLVAVPEPGPLAGAVAGVLGLSALYAVRRRRRADPQW